MITKQQLEPVKAKLLDTIEDLRKVIVSEYGDRDVGQMQYLTSCQEDLTSALVNLTNAASKGIA